MAAAFHSSASRIFWLLAAFICIVFLIGGSSRFDVASLALLRPLSAIVVCVAIGWLSGDAIKSYRPLIFFAMAVLAAVGVQLIPLPPAIWGALPGRELAISADAALGLQGQWRPISLAPSATWNALFSLLVPLAVLLLVVSIDRAQQFKLVLIILALILLSGVLGILQTLGPERGPLYFYRLTNWGASVGLFANRNHQAILLACGFPLLAVFASWKQSDTSQTALRRVWGAVCAGLLLVPMIIVTGSRAGLLAGVLAMGTAFWIYRGEPKKKQNIKSTKGKRLQLLHRHWIGILVAAIIIALLVLVYLGRRQIFQMGSEDVAGDLRFAVFQPVMSMIAQYFPLGSGYGAFPDVYRIAEPDPLLNHTYLNHVHNDWLEVVLGGGLISLILLGIGITYVSRRLIALLRLTPDQQRRSVVIAGKAGLAIIALCAFASIFDYPIRVPSFSVLMVIAFVWLHATSLPAEKKLEGRGNVV